MIVHRTEQQAVNAALDAAVRKAMEELGQLCDGRRGIYEQTARSIKALRQVERLQRQQQEIAERMRRREASRIRIRFRDY